MADSSTVDGYAVKIKPETLDYSVVCLGSDWDSWENNVYVHKHVAFGNLTYHSFVCFEDTALVPWTSSVAYILKPKVRSGAAVALDIRVSSKIAAVWGNCALESVEIWYSSKMKVRYFKVVLRQV